MYVQNHINADSIKAVQDSLKNISEGNSIINSLGFNISNIGNNEIVLTVLGYGIVFLALLLLFLVFSNLTKLLAMIRTRRLKAAGKHMAEHDGSSISGETAAAISLALSLHFQEAHDIENTIITIKKVQSTYSPWNSKLYGMRQYPKN